MPSEENLCSQHTFQHRKFDEDRNLLLKYDVQEQLPAMSQGMFGERIIIVFKSLKRNNNFFVKHVKIFQQIIFPTSGEELGGSTSVPGASAASCVSLAPCYCSSLCRSSIEMR